MGQARDAGNVAGDAEPLRPAGHRATLLAHLIEGLRTALVAGDLIAAQVTHEAIGKLLGETSSAVIDLAEERRRRR